MSCRSGGHPPKTACGRICGPHVLESARRMAHVEYMVPIRHLAASPLLKGHAGLMQAQNLKSTVACCSLLVVPCCLLLEMAARPRSLLTLCDPHSHRSPRSFFLHALTTQEFGPQTCWFAVAGMLLFRIMFSLSLGPLPFIITAEVQPGPVG